MTQQCLRCHRGISQGTHRPKGSANPFCLDCTANAEAIFAEAFARLDVLDLELYHRGFVRSGPAVWHRAPVTAAQGAGKRHGKPNSTELKPVPLDLMPSGGAKA